MKNFLGMVYEQLHISFKFHPYPTEYFEKSTYRVNIVIKSVLSLKKKKKVKLKFIKITKYQSMVGKKFSNNEISTFHVKQSINVPQRADTQLVSWSMARTSKAHWGETPEAFSLRKRLLRN